MQSTLYLIFKSTNHLQTIGAFPAYRVSVLRKQACLTAKRAINAESTGIWNHSIMTDCSRTALTLMRRTVLLKASSLAGSSYHSRLRGWAGWYEEASYHHRSAVNSWCLTSLRSLFKSHVPFTDQLFRVATQSLIIKLLELLYYKTGVALCTLTSFTGTLLFTPRLWLLPLIF